MTKIIIASSKNWFFKNINVKKFIKKKNIKVIKKKGQLKHTYLRKINPQIIFFPHWSYKVNKKIIKKYKCICFHTAPLPFGRGGSPIQNLILRNFKKAPVCALKMTNQIDAGPIYIKKTMDLSGNLNQIFNRMSFIIIEMIKILIKKNINPKKQVGRVYKFKRIRESQSEIKKEKNLNEIYNKIRMLDTEEYPRSYIKKNNFKIFFSNPILKKNFISCNAKILKSK